MASSTIFLIGLSITLVLNIAIIVYIRKPLFRVLVDLCGTEDRANFWATNSHILIVLVPLMFAMLYRPSSDQTEIVFFVSSQLFWALFGLIGTILVQSIIINQFIPRMPLPPKENV